MNHEFSIIIQSNQYFHANTLQTTTKRRTNLKLIRIVLGNFRYSNKKLGIKHEELEKFFIDTKINIFFSSIYSTEELGREVEELVTVITEQEIEQEAADNDCNSEAEITRV